MKVLSFGHMPSWAGGRQESGLANVIYQLAYHMSQYDEVEMTLAATDCSQPELDRDSLRIFGWTKGILIKHILLHPLTSLTLFARCLKYRGRYPGVFSTLGTYLKMVFYHYALSKVRPDVAHLHGIFAVLYIKIVPRGVKTLVTMHGTCGNDPNLENYEAKGRMEKDICNDSTVNHIVFIAEGVRDNFKKLYGEIKTPTSIVLNAYDANSFHYIDHKIGEKPILMTVASLSQLKGQMRVLEGIVKSNRVFSYWCVGADGNGLEEDLQNYADEHDIDFKYYGRKYPKEIRELLAYANYMIMPSSSEGFGLTYLESMACGVPVILPKDLPIVKEKGIIIPSINSILLEDCSSDSIAKVLTSLDGMTFEREKVAETMAPFSWQSISREYVKLVKNL